MNQVAFEIIRGVLKKRILLPLFAKLGVAFTNGKESFLFGSFDNQWIDVDRPWLRLALWKRAFAPFHTSSFLDLARPW